MATILDQPTLAAAIEFLQADGQANDGRYVCALHKMRVNGDLLTRQEVADLLKLELIRLLPNPN